MFFALRATKHASLTLCWPYFYSLGNINPKKDSLGMWLSDICKNKCANAKVPPLEKKLIKISPFTAVEFRLCNIPKLTYSLIYYSC